MAEKGCNLFFSSVTFNSPHFTFWCPCPSHNVDNCLYNWSAHFRLKEERDTWLLTSKEKSFKWSYYIPVKVQPPFQSQMSVCSKGKKSFSLVILKRNLSKYDSRYVPFCPPPVMRRIIGNTHWVSENTRRNKVRGSLSLWRTPDTFEGIEVPRCYKTKHTNTPTHTHKWMSIPYTIY